MGVCLWNVSDSVLQLFIRSYNLCIKKFVWFQKCDRNRHVYAIIGLPTPMTLIVNARFRCQQRFIKSNCYL
jgi:hypothetical protein